MKKILSLLIIITLWISNSFWCINESKKNCESWINDFCTENYNSGKWYDEFLKVYVTDFERLRKMKDDVSEIIWCTLIQKTLNTIKYEKENKLDNFYLEIAYLYENKYNNHAFYYVKFSDYKFKDKNLTEKEKEEFTENLYKKYEDKIWFYIDDKLVINHKDQEKYKTVKEFFEKNKIMAFDNKDKYIYWNENYKLHKNAVKKLNSFIKKVEDKKINKEKILWKIDKLYNKYYNLPYEWERRQRIIVTLEVLSYLHTEILISKFKE